MLVPNLMRGVGVEAGGGLVQEDESWIAEQRYADVAPLGLPACGLATHVSCQTDGLNRHREAHAGFICVPVADSSDIEA